MLPTAKPTADSVTLDIIFARAPLGDEAINRDVWNEIDEQQLSSDLRRDLRRNGFRAGVVGGHVPSALASLMHMTDEPVESPQETGVKLDDEPLVRRRVLQLASGKRGEILASRIYDEAPVLLNRDGQLSGQTFHAAQGVFAIRAHVDHDGRIRLALTPELHHGEPTKQWSGGNEGIFQLNMAKPRELFERLAIDTALAPGQMLVVTCLGDRAGSLGHTFFSNESARGPEQKVLLIRVSQTPSAGLFAPETDSDELDSAGL